MALRPHPQTRNPLRDCTPLRRRRFPCLLQKMKTKLYIGTAGWNVPGIHAHNFESEGTHLVRYARKLNCAEINSCFYREHKPETYAKWAASVPEDFRFAVKAPRSITHEGALRVEGEEALKCFLQQTSALGAKRGPVLLQIPPKLEFSKVTASAFFSMFRRLYDGPAVLEPRHVSWFNLEADSMLRKFCIARVAADPALNTPCRGARRMAGAGLLPASWIPKALLLFLFRRVSFAYGRKAAATPKFHHGMVHL